MPFVACRDLKFEGRVIRAGEVYPGFPKKSLISCRRIRFVDADGADPETGKWIARRDLKFEGKLVRKGEVFPGVPTQSMKSIRQVIPEEESDQIKNTDTVENRDPPPVVVTADQAASGTSPDPGQPTKPNGNNKKGQRKKRKRGRRG